MRRALATTALVGGLLGGSAVVAGPVQATAPAAASLATGVDVDEPLEQDGEDDTGKYGLIGLTGLLGLFGYKKYRDTRTHRDTRAQGPGSRRT